MSKKKTTRHAVRAPLAKAVAAQIVGDVARRLDGPTARDRKLAGEWMQLLTDREIAYPVREANLAALLTAVRRDVALVHELEGQIRKLRHDLETTSAAFEAHVEAADRARR